MEVSLKTAPRRMAPAGKARRRKMEIRVDREKIQEYLASQYALGC